MSLPSLDAVVLTRSRDALETDTPPSRGSDGVDGDGTPAAVPFTGTNRVTVPAGHDGPIPPLARARTGGPCAVPALLLSMAMTALGVSAEVRSDDVPGVPLAVAFYADASCLLTFGRQPSVGKTQIDADVDAGGSRMLIHCDTEDGRRLTMLARGERFARNARVALLSRADVEGGEDGVIAWLTRTDAADDGKRRRYLTRGHVVIRETAPVEVDGTALHGDRMAFARVDGELETPSSHPGDVEMPSGD